jgi:hypothetical protein
MIVGLNLRTTGAAFGRFLVGVVTKGVFRYPEPLHPMTPFETRESCRFFLSFWDSTIYIQSMSLAEAHSCITALLGESHIISRSTRRKLEAFREQLEREIAEANKLPPDEIAAH